MSKSYNVSGMTCGGCARSVEAAIKAVAPQASVTADAAKGQVTVEGANAKQVEVAVRDAGFDFQGEA